MAEKLATSELTNAWHRWNSERDRKAWAALVEHYVPFVRYLAGQLRPQVSRFSGPELFSLGLMGLIDALEKFDPSMGVRFETYASTRIRGAMRDGVRRIECVPRGDRSRSTAIVRKVTPVDFQTARTRGGVKVQDLLADPEASSALDILELQADNQELLAAIEALPERERLVIRHYYFDGYFLKEIGEVLGITESRACQIHRSALRALEISLIRLRAA